MLKNLRIFPGAKTVRCEFLLPGGKLPFAKILLEPAKPVLRIEVGGAAAPPNRPGVLHFCNSSCRGIYGFAKIYLFRPSAMSED